MRAKHNRAPVTNFFLLKDPPSLPYNNRNNQIEQKYSYDDWAQAYHRFLSKATVTAKTKFWDKKQLKAQCCVRAVRETAPQRLIMNLIYDRICQVLEFWNQVGSSKYSPSARVIVADRLQWRLKMASIFWLASLAMDSQRFLTSRSVWSKSRCSKSK